MQAVRRKDPEDDPLGLGRFTLQGNAHRDIQARMGKHSVHAERYATDIKVWDQKEAKQTKEEVHFLLPYEEYDALYGDMDPSNFQTVAPGSGLSSTMAKWKSACQIGPDEPIMGVGIWGDLAPLNNRDGMLILLWNSVTGIVHDRHPICAMSKRMLCKCGCKGRCTFDDLFRVVLWIRVAWLTQSYPAARDDGVEFKDSKRVGDKARAKWATRRRNMRCKAGCVQKRGDWAW
jgi:hypothetical protein